MENDTQYKYTGPGNLLDNINLHIFLHFNDEEKENQEIDDEEDSNNENEDDEALLQMKFIIVKWKRQKVISH